ncbi:TPA: hypothetical protein EYG96_02295 [Candidatus Gracilibacteria bacterium]|nr:hypothetical protein [Candidatus Gracilibacteria bacterium]
MSNSSFAGNIQNINEMLKAQKLDSQNDTAQAGELSELKSELHFAGIYDQQERKKKEDQLRMILENALFLQEDAERKKRWLNVITEIPFPLLSSLIPACIRENLRFKQHKRNLVVELNKKRANDWVA